MQDKIRVNWIGKGCRLYVIPFTLELHESLQEFSGNPENSPEDSLFDPEFYTFPGPAYKRSLKSLSQSIFHGLLLEPRNRIEFRKNARKKRSVSALELIEPSTLFPLFLVNVLPDHPIKNKSFLAIENEMGRIGSFSLEGNQLNMDDFSFDVLKLKAKKEDLCLLIGMNYKNRPLLSDSSDTLVTGSYVRLIEPE